METGESKIKELWWIWCLVKAHFWIIDDRPLSVHCEWERGERALWVPFYKGANPVHEGSTLMI